MYKTAFVAGTFDGLHKGHQAFIGAAFSVGEKVIIGLTSDAYITAYKPGLTAIAPFEKRKEAIVAWLTPLRWLYRTTIIPIDDPYEPAVSGPYDVLLVTEENKHRGEEINQKRIAKGLSSLILLQAEMVNAADGKPISSTRMRSGEIETSGKLVMPESLRSTLQMPMGTLLSGAAIGQSLVSQKGNTIVTVGDLTTKTALDALVAPTLGIIDLKLRREPYHALDGFVARMGRVTQGISSGPGYIAKESIAFLQTWSKAQAFGTATIKLLLIDGEEDLLTLPVITYAPLGTIVYYGQPLIAGIGEGIVEVVVTREKQKEAAELLKQFT